MSLPDQVPTEDLRCGWNCLAQHLYHRHIRRSGQPVHRLLQHRLLRYLMPRKLFGIWYAMTSASPRFNRSTISVVSLQTSTRSEPTRTQDPKSHGRCKPRTEDGKPRRCHRTDGNIFRHRCSTLLPSKSFFCNEVAGSEPYSHSSGAHAPRNASGGRMA